MSALTGAQLGLMTGSFLSGCLLSIPLLSIPTITSPSVLSHSPPSASAPLLLSSWSTLYKLGSLTMPPLAILTASLYAWSAHKSRTTPLLTTFPLSLTSTSPSPSTSPQTKKRIPTWKLFTVAAGLTLAIIPFTLVVMLPTNTQLHRLNEMQIEPGPLVSSLQEVKELVRRWNWLHILRSMGPVVGCVVGWVGVFASGEEGDGEETGEKA